MLDIKKRKTMVRERALAEGLREFVAELRLVDVVDYIAFLRLERYGNLDDIVASSAEPYFKPGVLRFANSGEVLLGWGEVPVVHLAMEFRYGDVTTHFRLELGASTAAVDITYIAFDGPEQDAECQTERLLKAIGDARLAR